MFLTPVISFRLFYWLEPLRVCRMVRRLMKYTSTQLLMVKSYLCLRPTVLAFVVQKARCFLSSTVCIKLSAVPNCKASLLNSKILKSGLSTLILGKRIALGLSSVVKIFQNQNKLIEIPIAPHPLPLLHYFDINLSEHMHNDIQMLIRQGLRP